MSLFQLQFINYNQINSSFSDFDVRNNLFRKDRVRKLKQNNIVNVLLLFDTHDTDRKKKIYFFLNI